MPSRAQRPCKRPGCKAIAIQRGYCAEHQRTAIRRTYDNGRASAYGRGYGAKWRKLRLVQLAREPYCRHCKDHDRLAVATDVDHIVPRRSGGSDSFENLQSLCHSCHSRKTATEMQR